MPVHGPWNPIAYPVGEDLCVLPRRNGSRTGTEACPYNKRNSSLVGLFQRSPSASIQLGAVSFDSMTGVEISVAHLIISIPEVQTLLSVSDKAASIAARNGPANCFSFVSPTPLTSANSASVRGQRRAMSINVRS